MARIVHFEIHVDDMERAKKFYGEVFGWRYEDYSEYTGFPYFGAITGTEGEPGIDGGLKQREGPKPQKGEGMSGYVCTLQVADYDATEKLILEQGGSVSSPKTLLPEMAWQGYYTDTEGNVFGIHQPLDNAG